MSGTHARLSASRTSQFFECTGSVHLAEYFEEEDSEYSSEGTIAHDVGEKCLREGTDPIMEAADPKMGEAVQMYVDYVRELQAQSDGHLEIEMKIESNEFGPDFGGHADAVVIGENGLHVVDYKHGVGIAVDIEGNTQLLYYAFGVLASYPRDEIDPDMPVFITIVQPRGFHPDGPIRTEELSAGEVIAWGYDELLPAMRRVDEEPDIYRTGEHCRFCPAKLVCPAMKQLEEDIMALDVEELEGMSDEDLSERYEKSKAIHMLLKAIHGECFKRAKEGAPVPGTKLVYGRSSRDWKDENAIKAVVEKFGEDAFTDPRIKSPNQIEDLPGGKAFVKEYGYKKKGGPTLVAEDAKGEVYKVQKAGAAFASIEVPGEVDSVAKS